MLLTRKLGYFFDIQHFKIITRTTSDNIILGLLRWCQWDPPVSARDERVMGFNPWLKRSPGRGHGDPFQYSCLENPMDRGAWQATVHRVTYQAIPNFQDTYIDIIYSYKSNVIIISYLTMLPMYYKCKISLTSLISLFKRRENKSLEIFQGKLLPGQKDFIQNLKFAKISKGFG